MSKLSNQGWIKYIETRQYYPPHLVFMIHNILNSVVRKVIKRILKKDILSFLILDETVTHLMDHGNNDDVVYLDFV